VRLAFFVLASLLRGRLAFAVWELAEVAEWEALVAGDHQRAADLHCSWWARAARNRLRRAGFDLPLQRARLHRVRAALKRRA